MEELLKTAQEFLAAHLEISEVEIEDQNRNLRIRLSKVWGAYPYQLQPSGWVYNQEGAGFH